MADSQDTILQKIKEQGDLVRKLKAAKESSEKVSVVIYSSLIQGFDQQCLSIIQRSCIIQLS